MCEFMCIFCSVKRMRYANYGVSSVMSNVEKERGHEMCKTRHNAVFCQHTFSFFTQWKLFYTRASWFRFFCALSRYVGAIAGVVDSSNLYMLCLNCTRVYASYVYVGGVNYTQFCMCLFIGWCGRVIEV